jgi:hypothetical protein
MKLATLRPPPACLKILHTLYASRLVGEASRVVVAVSRDGVLGQGAAATNRGACRET